MTSNRHGTGPVAVVLGTRPEIIKLARIVDLLGDDAHLVHTGQHYDENLSDTFFTEFAMRPPDTFIGVGGQTRGQQIGSATAALDDLFAELRPSAVVVQGDTNSVAAGALAANANEIPLVHVEAGLRSFDRRMPEEHNRIIADHLSDLCLAPTDLNVRHLHDEGIDGSRVTKTGNPVIEAVERLLPPESERLAILERYGVQPGAYVLGTFHRPENVDNPETLATILTSLGGIDRDVLLPLHPRTRARIDAFGLGHLTDGIIVVDPIGYRDFIGLGAESLLIVSDSGGVQEEVTVFRKPSIVVRRSTERQEVEGTFVERVEPNDALPGILAERVAGADAWTARLADLPNPYGDATAPARSVAAIHELVGR